jgi:hypothetical protein
LHTFSNRSLSAQPTAFPHDLSLVAETGDFPDMLWFKIERMRRFYSFPLLAC